MTFALTPQQFASRAAAVSVAIGQAITKDRGTVQHSGVLLGYDYNGTDTLTVTLLKKPFLVSTSYVERQITDWFSVSE